MLRKVTIVIEETGEQGGKGFNVYMGGDSERLLAGIQPEQMSIAEWWGSKLFSICCHALRQANVINSTVDRRTPPPTGTPQ